MSWGEQAQIKELKTELRKLVAAVHAFGQVETYDDEDFYPRLNEMYAALAETQRFLEGK